jgi:2-dehydro-3-deoxyglucarate aldolase
VAELIARLGYDWVVVDMEHGSFSRSQLPDMFRAIECGGAAPFARPAAATPDHIRAVLDCGARGLILPMIESRAQLDAAVCAAMYPGGKEFSAGRRGVGFSRSNTYGLDFVAELDPDAGAARDIVLVAQIEHVNALQELDAIFSHPRLDAYMVGRYDFSASMGLIGDFTQRDFLAAEETIRTKAATHRLPELPGRIPAQVREETRLRLGKGRDPE